MDVLEAIKGRRSIRRYKYKELEHNTLIKLLEAARWAPSGGNRQPWQFIAVTDRKKIKMLKMASPGFYGEEANLVLVLCLEKERIMKSSYDVCLDLGMAAQNIMLAAYALGLGSCAIASFTSRAINRILDVPDTLAVKLLISIGYPAQTPKMPPRRSLSELVYINGCLTRWGETE
ncbi:MAG: nitroreductase family protein [Candidatus Heimdallarchaeota archaeon]